MGVAQIGFAAQATYWSAFDLHKAVMPIICEALDRPLQGMRPEETTALAVMADLRLAGVAVDDHARVMVETDASTVYEASPLAADKRVAEIVRPALVQSADNVSPKSPARAYGVCKATIEVFGSSGGGSGCEATRRNASGTTGHHAQCGGRGTGTCWTAMHKSPTELAQNAKWRMATALRLGATPDAGPRSTCALRKGNDGDMCEHSLAAHPFHPFCCK